MAYGGFPDASGLVQLVRLRLAERRMRKMMRGLPWTRIADLPEDTLGKVSAIVRPHGAVIEAPVSGRPCVYYSVIVEEERTTGATALLAREQDCATFTLEDHGAHAIVAPVAATFWVGFDYIEEVRLARELSPRARELCARHHAAFHYWTSKEVRVREAVIELDDRIAVVGAGVREPVRPGEARLYRDADTNVLRLAGAPRFPLLVSDELVGEQI